MKYCQHNEEDIIEKYLGHVDIGTYVDVGAGWYADLSNTYHLYLKGWSGLIVEPCEELYEDHVKYRPNDVHVHAAITNYIGDVDMCDTATVGSYIGDQYATVGTLTGVRHPIRKERGLTMNALIKEHPEFSDPDFFSLDVETNEDKVLDACDFEIFTPTLMIIENVVRGVDYRGRWMHYIEPYYELVETIIGNLAFLRK